LGINEYSSYTSRLSIQTEKLMSNKESRLVYSTDAGRIKETLSEQPIETDGIVRIRRETKGRKGKGVTTVSGVGLAEAELKTLAKKLKQKCSTGGTVKDGVIEIQGDHREKLKSELEKLGHNVKLAGG
jgi:translation initiation factor 1